MEVICPGLWFCCHSLFEWCTKASISFSPASAEKGWEIGKCDMCHCLLDLDLDLVWGSIQ